MTTAAPLRAFIEENSLGQADAAKALGVHPTTVSGWLREDKIPDYAARNLVLHSEVAKARQEARDAVEGRGGKKAVVISGNSLDVDAVVGVAERFDLDTLDLSGL